MKSYSMLSLSHSIFREFSFKMSTLNVLSERGCCTSESSINDHIYIWICIYECLNSSIENLFHFHCGRSFCHLYISLKKNDSRWWFSLHFEVLRAHSSCHSHTMFLNLEKAFLSNFIPQMPSKFPKVL